MFKTYVRGGKKNNKFHVDCQSVLWWGKYNDNSTCPFRCLKLFLFLCCLMDTWPGVHCPWFSSSSWFYRINRINQSAHSSIYEDSSLFSLLGMMARWLMRKPCGFGMIALGACSQCWFMLLQHLNYLLSSGSTRRWFLSPQNPIWTKMPFTKQD